MLRDLFKRSSIYFGFLMVSRFVSIASFVIFARALLPEQFGTLVLYSTLGHIAVFLGDFGLIQWYQKKAHKENTDILFSKLINTRLLTLILSIILTYALLSSVRTFPPHIVLVFLLTMIPDSFFSIVDGVYFHSKKSFKVGLKIGVRMTLLLLGFFIFNPGATYETYTYLYFIATLLALIWYFPWKLLKYFKLQPLSESIDILKSSSAYAFLIFTSYAYARGDSVIIGYSLGNAALGIYGAAYRFLESLSLIPTALAHNLFPESTKEGNVSLKQVKKMTLAMFLVGVIISMILYFYSDFFVLTVLGTAYLSAVPLLQIFSLVTLLFFISSPLNTVILSSKLVSKFLPYGMVNTLLNIVLNIIFVPMFGILAAAWVMLTTEVIGLLINLYFVRKVYS